MELNKVNYANCINEMRKLQERSIDLIVTDPPYLMSYQSNYRKQKHKEIVGDKDEQLIKDFIYEANRLLKENSAIYIFCSWHQIDFFKQEVEKYFNIKNIIVWVKNNTSMGDLEASYAPKYELIIYANKGRRKLEGFRYADVIEEKRISTELHPTEKPVDLLERFILSSSKKGDVVLDPFMGSGSTAIACLNTERHYLGYEIYKPYYEVCQKRIKNHRFQYRLEIDYD